jgi:hypothetical protein
MPDAKREKKSGENRRETEKEREKREQKGCVEQPYFYLFLKSAISPHDSPMLLPFVPLTFVLLPIKISLRHWAVCFKYCQYYSND